MVPTISAARNTLEVELKECFADPLVDGMNFLNQIVMEHPMAISFALGQPIEEHFNVERSLQFILEFVRVSARSSSMPEQKVWQRLGQYGQSRGGISELIAWQLERDEGIRVPPEAIIVTVGAQEALAVILTGLFDATKDVLLVSDPTYVGITGLARVLGIPVLAIPSTDDGLDLNRLEQVLQEYQGIRKPKALYDIPDFSNPLGTTLSMDRRVKLLDICHKYKLLFIEDSSYRTFRYEDGKLPSVKSLDSEHIVLYVGSVSSMLFPGVRLGFLVADQLSKTGKMLAKELCKVKSLLTINTSPLLQGLVGGILLANGGSLQHLVLPKIKALYQNRNVMLGSLADYFSDMQGLVRWTRPKGGFFITVTLPFSFGEEELKHCASEYGVIVCPMRYFSISGERQNQIRLSFSDVDEEQIPQGIKRLAAFVRNYYCGIRSTKNGYSFSRSLRQSHAAC